MRTSLTYEILKIENALNLPELELTETFGSNSLNNFNLHVSYNTSLIFLLYISIFEIFHCDLKMTLRELLKECSIIFSFLT